MKLLLAISTIILSVSGRIFNDPKIQTKYINSAEDYQSGVEQQQNGIYLSQSNNYAGQEVTNHRPEGEKTAKILSYHAENDGHQYRYSYETDNGIKVEEEGKIEKGTSAHGVFSFKGDDGHVYTITYTADENGFRPSGDHLPTPPPIPEAILKSLEKNAKDEAAGIFDDGKYHEHQELGHHKNQQSQGGHQSVEYQSSGNSGVDLSYYAVAGGQESNLGHHESSAHSSANSNYFIPSKQYVSYSDQQSSVSQGVSSGYESSGFAGSSGYQSSSGQENSFGGNSGYQSSSGQENSHGQQFLGNKANLGYQASSGNEANLGYQSSSGEASLGHHYSLSHGVVDHQGASGHGSGYSSSNYVYRAPSGFTPMSTRGGITGHISRLSYLPPSKHVGSRASYHSRH